MKIPIVKFKRLLVGAAAVAVMTGLLGCRGEKVKADDTQIQADARALQEFNKRVAVYVQLHHQLEAKHKIAHIKATYSGADIVKRQHLLGDRIRAARSGAKEGDIFTPEIAAYFRRAIDAAYLTNTEGISASLACVPPIEVEKIKANGIYPESSDYNIMPPTILLHIPRLPEELEYRIVVKDLIIRDVEANVVIDRMHDAIQSLPEGAKCDD